MNIHLPAILGFTRYQGFDPSPYPAVGFFSFFFVFEFGFTVLPYVFGHFNCKRVDHDFIVLEMAMLWKFGQGRHGSHWKDQVTTCFFFCEGPMLSCVTFNTLQATRLPPYRNSTLSAPEFSKHKDASAQAHVKSNLSNLIPEVLAEPYEQWHGLLCC